RHDMSQSEPSAETTPAPSSQHFEYGGLRFDVAFRGSAGATLRVDGQVDGQWKELLRFDDFVDVPHFHAPADADQIEFDRTNGEPLEWYLSQIRDHLAEWLTKSGFAAVLPDVDTAEVAANVDTLREAMYSCVPAGFVRVPGVGLQRAT
ncbi:MAG TPA: hypothetical protein VGQ20_15825, partial [Acidimicrobiales bacterium]|nr:hypothetical protein [Acidimicrobiales bacterium]